MFYTIGKISGIVEGKLMGNPKIQIDTLLIDSRSYISNRACLFFALKGDRNDGHKYIDELYSKQVYCFIVEQLPMDIKKYSLANFILVSDVLDALQRLSAYHRALYKGLVIGITGSNGKTIIKEWLFQLLHDKKKIIRSPKSYNSQIGVPLSAWMLDNSYELAILEAGISRPGEMANLEKIIKPQIGIFTNIGDAHQENFVDLKQKVNEKLLLFKDADIIFYCIDNEIIESEIICCGYKENKKLVSWSTIQKSDLQIFNIEKTNSTTLLEGIYKNTTISLTIPFIDNASVENCIHLWLVMLFFGYDIKEIQESVNNLIPVAMRLELKEGINNCLIINDSYNSDLNSLIVALDSLKQQKQKLKKTLILSDILQSTQDEKTLYREVATIINDYKIQRFIGIGNALMKNKENFNQLTDRKFYSTIDDFLMEFSKERFSNEFVLLKGSRNFRFEQISDLLQQKTHRTVLEINMNAILHNFNYFKSQLKPSTRLMIMVKAFSYGSGSYEIANLLQNQGVEYLGVAVSDEGVELRKAGIGIPIIVMNPEFQSFANIIEYQLEPEIYNFTSLELFQKEISKLGVTSYPVHIKLDTGMHRLGFEVNEIDELIKQLKKFNNLKVESVFSHLAASDEPQNDSFTIKQIELFKVICEQIKNELNYSFLRHILNSSGVERFNQFQFDMVRLGIGLYGISAKDQSKLKYISTFKTRILQIKELETDETVGYGRKGILKKPSKIAIIPIGYADGLNRKFGNGIGKVQIKGRLFPIIGNICMDICMVDITGFNAREGDEVIIFSDNYSITELAKQIDTIPYEILTGISRRVKRVYIQEYK